MISFAVVTTCNAENWAVYGRRMVESFDRHWPVDIPLLLYAEGFVPDNSRATIVRLPDWLECFKRRHANNPVAHGLSTGKLDFRFNCVRYAHKVAAVIDAALSADVDVLIWMDADTLTHSDVTNQWLESLFDSECYIGWLDRAKMYPETGFYMLNCRHSEHRSMMAEFRGFYESGQVFNLRETHDCMVLQAIIDGAVAKGRIKAHSLSGIKGRTCSHPLVNSRLAECFDHLKGTRKAEGKSRRTDIRIDRKEAYWRC